MKASKQARQRKARRRAQAPLEANAVACFLQSRLRRLPQASLESSGERVFVRLQGRVLATLAVRGREAVVEFKPLPVAYGHAVQAVFVRRHPVRSLARTGWLKARPRSQGQARKLYLWIAAAARAAHLQPSARTRVR